MTDSQLSVQQKIKIKPLSIEIVRTVEKSCCQSGSERRREKRPKYFREGRIACDPIIPILYNRQNFISLPLPRIWKALGDPSHTRALTTNRTSIRLAVFARSRVSDWWSLRDCFMFCRPMWCKWVRLKVALDTLCARMSFRRRIGSCKGETN